MFCEYCGVNIKENSNSICMNCGCKVNADFKKEKSEKSKITAFALQFCFGSLGLGRFYIGSKKIAICQLLATCICVAGLLFSLITIKGNLDSGAFEENLTDELISDTFSNMFRFIAFCVLTALVCLTGVIDGFYLLLTDSKDSKGKYLK